MGTFQLPFAHSCLNMAKNVVLEPRVWIPKQNFAAVFPVAGYTSVRANRHLNRYLTVLDAE